MSAFLSKQGHQQNIKRGRSRITVHSSPKENNNNYNTDMVTSSTNNRTETSTAITNQKQSTLFLEMVVKNNHSLNIVSLHLLLQICPIDLMV